MYKHIYKDTLKHIHTYLVDGLTLCDVRGIGDSAMHVHTYKENMYIRVYNTIRSSDGSRRVSAVSAETSFES